jgi:hypothetical protein
MPACCAVAIAGKSRTGKTAHNAGTARDHKTRISMLPRRQSGAHNRPVAIVCPMNLAVAFDENLRKSGPTLKQKGRHLGALGRSISAEAA